MIFNGILTIEVRNALKNKRKELNLTRTGLANALGVECATISNWEDGTTKSCTPFMAKILSSFLNGSLDSKILRYSQNLPNSQLINNTQNAIDSLKKLATLYKMCNSIPNAQQEIINKLSQLTQK